MKALVKPNTAGARKWLKIDEELTVLLVSVYGSGEIKLLIWSDLQGSAVLFPCEDFEIIDPRPSKRWIVNFEKWGMSLSPASWCVDGFWDAYHEGDAEADRIFEEEKARVINEALS
ncbi:TPA: hypothetical protein HH295_21410 [Xanthomonas vasicola pv. zeae]|uniref:DUF2442 domain-containing protein n=1 Tax=Xanthomonas vasicola TaxID=56459 RepID=A0ABD7S4T8_XANVA|nr:hypothetical protein [Xanthomonas vasicola]MDO6958033.1 hypothetical protein [Xanthomonas vasicola]MDO6975030.1 hypothetical protein [Xanthomonas vasicola]TWQ15781.1 hypothetical protein FQK00_00520 [Xanthomonas vasicola]TWQ32282.1 hypothetical protein FQJ99_22615 [Xanthomonas vasicola]TWQ42408.1 hypothetical protein FQJ98_22700 [Xanthomonas vasicola]